MISNVTKKGSLQLEEDCFLSHPISVPYILISPPTSLWKDTSEVFIIQGKPLYFVDEDLELAEGAVLRLL